MNQTTTSSAAPLRVDLDALLRSRIPGIRKWLPTWLVRATERFIRQDDLNALMEANDGRKDADFCAGVLRELNAGYHIEGEEHLPAAEDRRAIFVCNHPLGALDGIVIIDMLAKQYGPEVKFVVNDLLSVLKPLDGVFLPVNKHGRQNRQAAEALDRAFESDAPVIVFPAGLVSRRQKGGVIADLKWNKMFITRAIRHRRDIVPMRFDGRNSDFFYNFARLRSKLGVKFNIEMICLPREVFGCRDKQFTITIGEPIRWESLAEAKDTKADESAARIRELVYSL